MLMTTIEVQKITRPGQFIRDDDILCLSWSDKMQVNLTSTVQNNETFQKQV